MGFRRIDIQARSAPVVASTSVGFPPQPFGPSTRPAVKWGREVGVSAPNPPISFTTKKAPAREVARAVRITGTDEVHVSTVWPISLLDVLIRLRGNALWKC